MEFEFAKYTEITDLAFELNPDYKTESYVRFFICPDTNDYWFVRVLEGFNEDYEREEGVYLLERNNIPKMKGEKLTTEIVKEIILDDCGENWDIHEYQSIDELIDDLDGGHGILNLNNKNK
jgi:hypothetical protein